MNNAAKTVPRILRDNICTGFNALNLMIALALAAVGAWRNLANGSRFSDSPGASSGPS